MAFSTDIYDLVTTEFTARDGEWEKAFLHSVLAAQLKVLTDTPVAGPDGWPYLMAEITAEGSEPANKVLSWLSERGIGLVVNPNKESPDYVFSYGMIWNFRERGEFFSPQAIAVVNEKVEFKGNENVLAGPPTEAHLPPYARSVLKSFFKDNGVAAMKILVMSSVDDPKAEKNKGHKHYDLCFSLESFGNPSSKEHKGILEALSWFLPAHYSLMLISEQGLPAFSTL